MKLSDFKVLTFDTYGTLIDWETGIYNALLPLTSKCPDQMSRDEILETFAEVESAQQSETPAMIYSELLAKVYQTLAGYWDVEIDKTEVETFGQSVKDWPAFIDSPSSLQYLKKHYKLVTLTNCDRKSYKGSNERLQIEFDAIYTAQDVGSYKPDPRNFEYMLEHLKSDFGIEKHEILHTAQSLFHDHVPAKEFGLATAWIDRRHDVEGWGATAAPEKKVTTGFKFKSMAGMVKAHQQLMNLPA